MGRLRLWLQLSGWGMLRAGGEAGARTGQKKVPLCGGHSSGTPFAGWVIALCRQGIASCITQHTAMEQEPAGMETAVSSQEKWRPEGPASLHMGTDVTP